VSVSIQINPTATVAHPEIYVPSRELQALRQVHLLFINMPLREHAVPNCMPLGPALMAARLQQHGATVGLLDLNKYRPWRTLDEVRALLTDYIETHGEPQTVALSGLITTLRWQADTARIVRELLPESYMISGGGLATDLPQLLLDWIPELDGTATGEGDDVIFKVALDGLKREKQGRPIYRGERPRHLDQLPFPAWDLIDMELYLAHPIWGDAANNSSSTPFTMHRSMNTISSRGCPFACRYCDRTATGGRNYGVRSAENLAAEAAELVARYNIDFLGIVDDNAMVRRDRLEALIPALAPLRDAGLRWGTHGRLDEAADLMPDGRQLSPRRLEWMAEAGCVYIGFGAESADPDVLHAMDKGGRICSPGMETVDGIEYPRAMIEGIRNCVEVGIHPNCTWIMGYPGETLPQLQRTISFILMMESRGIVATSNHNMFVATAYPGTEMFNDPVVQARIRSAFGDDYRHYVEELDDATKVIEQGGAILNYSAMDDRTFMIAREAIESGDLERVLSLS